MSPGGGGSGVVTPEAVPLDFEPAGVGSRSVALALDLVLQYGAILLVVIATTLVQAQVGAGIPGWAGVTLALLLVFTVLWGYPVAFETLLRGRTPGKAAMGLRVVTVEGAPVRFRHAAIRAALMVVDLYITVGAAAVISALVTPRSQRLGDLVAGTIVVRERTGAGTPTVARFQVPAGAEAYASTVDVSGVTPADYAAVRSFLLRARELEPHARDRVATRLAGPLAARLGHEPPPRVPATLFLACVAARYQQRATAGVHDDHVARPPSPGTARDAGTAKSGGSPSPADPDGGFAPPG